MVMFGVITVQPSLVNILHRILSWSDNDIKAEMMQDLRKHMSTHIPVTTADGVRSGRWDLTTTQIEILPHIDSFNHIAEITRVADVGTR